MNRKELEQLAHDWFTAQGWEPFPFQKQTWTAFLQGKHGLLNAPTGSGKTYALWIAIVLEYINQHPNYKSKPTKGLLAIWVTPLRALSVEIKQAAERFVNDLDVPLTVGIRSGDTSAKERASQKRKMPSLLITTPESLQLLLATKGYDKMFKNIIGVVVDEWHELVANKRGVQMTLALSRLNTIAPTMRTWGVSATIGNLDQAREVLFGVNKERLSNSVLIKAHIKKKINVLSIIPETIDKFPWRGHLGLHLLEHVIPILEESQSTLIFTNTRSQCEIWFQNILAKHPEFAGDIAMHHGSISRETRLWVETALREGNLKIVVCTSSLDLGVDFAPVDTIIQVGGPKGVSRFIQRAGRSGHQPGKTSVIYFLPTHALELLEASALIKAVSNTVVEDRVPYLNSFDVLVQYLVTLAVSDGFYPEEIFPEIKSTFCFQTLTKAQFQWILNFITLGGQSLQAYDEYKRVDIEPDGKFKVNSRAVAMRHRLQIGTIVSDAVLNVKFLKGGYIGSIEESFISKLRPGDVFTFAGRQLELFRVRNMQVLVKKSKQKNAKIPNWMGGRMSFSSEMSHLIREELYLLNSNEKQKTKELKALEPIVIRQNRESMVPNSDEFLIETFKTREGYHAVFYPFEGYFVHEAMGSLLAYRLSLLHPISFTIAFNDYGFELLSDQPIDIQAVLDNNLFSSEYLRSDLEKSINASEMAKRKFRDIAVISGLVFTGYPSKSVKSKHLQASSQLLFGVFEDYEPDNLLFQQAFTETFEHQLEEGRLQLALMRISTQTIIWKSCAKPTPFSFPIITDRLRAKLSSEKLADRIRRMTIQLEKS
ncbi:ligase-associated DNA damage response DEXH box helicase [Formosa algae]|uniref:ATP-dependent Lhr-like helicase n=1 Tax=Formosa algae TaxID=225843 RepID=A0A9X0YL25_9FLAO|nr:ligase-associated DNA damage response DEXH box helicase [Formosa algae]MBP1840579.1 ATP-dependent Lhr-like helicase [Formosa algae]MDQ0336008.1 ATP-dependent Lhr-like helicase [Formosa algae]OEI81103.1 DNA ligase-associated DEXH box helicase [Formosa algae]